MNLKRLILVVLALIFCVYLWSMAWHMGHWFLWRLRYQLRWDLFMVLGLIGVLFLGWELLRFVGAAFRRKD